MKVLIFNYIKIKRIKTVAYVDKGKPVERQGRKAMGLSEEILPMVARLPKHMSNEIYHLTKRHLGRPGALNFYMGCNKSCI